MSIVRVDAFVFNIGVFIMCLVSNNEQKNQTEEKKAFLESWVF